jgi:hypothetical protein
MTGPSPPLASTSGISEQRMDRETEEALCGIQAQVYAQRIALRALARTHPDPAAVLAAWRQAVTEAATCNPVVPASMRASTYLAEQVRAFADDWTAELVELAIPAPDGAPMRTSARTPWP